MSSSLFWQQLDAVLIINLNHRTDRWQAIHALISQWIPEDKIHRIEAIKGTEIPSYNTNPWFSTKTNDYVAKMRAGSAGCALSHAKALAYAANHHWEKTLILEDDVQFFDTLQSEKGEMITRVLNKPETWDMFYLGYYKKHFDYAPQETQIIHNEEFSTIRLQGPMLAHAIIFNGKTLPHFIHELPQISNIWSWISYYGSIDAWYQNFLTRDHHLKVWGTLPTVCMQITDFSDICDRKRTEKEQMGLHRQVIKRKVSLTQLEKTIPRPIFRKIYDKIKRSSRLRRDRKNGFTK